MYSFHVLLAAFFSDAKNEEVTREQWVVGGEPRQVLLSNLVMRGKYPASLDDVPDLIKAAELHLKGRQLPVGTHWMRLYFARAGETITSEALLDNEPDEALQSTIAAMPWATTTEFYSARYFLILQDGLDVSRAIATISQSEQSADETIRRKLMLHGSTGSQARRLVALVPLAFGRLFLTGKNITFPDRAVLSNPKTLDRAEVLLMDDPVFREALRIAKESLQRDTITTEDFAAVARRSAEVKTIIGAQITASRNLENTVLQPSIIHLSDEEHSPRSDQPLVSSKQKPWWKFWT